MIFSGEAVRGELISVERAEANGSRVQRQKAAATTGTCTVAVRFKPRCLLTITIRTSKEKDKDVLRSLAQWRLRRFKNGTAMHMAASAGTAEPLSDFDDVRTR